MFIGDKHCVGTLVNAGRIAFGLFEVNLQSREIWKAGYRVKLQGQPFKVLAALLAKPGQLVTHSELQDQVWGPDTNVDFERALAVAIKKVREALEDSAENPRFVETLTRRGYRFIAPITVDPTAAANPLSHPEQPHQISTYSPLLSASGPISGGDQETTLQRALVDVRPAQQKTMGWSKSRWAVVLAAALLPGAILITLAATFFDRAHPTVVPPLRVEQVTHDVPISAGPPSMESLLTLVTDGDRILTSVLVSGKSQLAAVDISTGGVQPFPIPQELASATLADISRDGSHLLLRSHLSSKSEQPLWIVPTAGGSAMRVGNILAQDATWMPDGNSILFATGDELKLAGQNGGTVTSFAKLPGRAFWLRWSPDGRLLRFTLMDPLTHTSSIWELTDANRSARPLLKSRVSSILECCGTWMADGKAYVFQATDNAESNLWEVDGDGATTNLTQLTNGPLRYFSPTAAHMSRRIYFYGSGQSSGLQRYNGEQIGFRPERTFLADANRVDYSRDKKWVAWIDTSTKLWRARAEDGSEKIQLTPNYLEVFLAQWSPDGSKLAVMAREPNQVWQIYLLSANGGKPERLLEDTRNAADPGWSSDGLRLVYGREPDLMGKESGSHAIQVFDLQSKSTTVLPESEGLFSPRWSPDGKWIAALTLEQNRVMLYEVAKKRWSVLATTSAADPAWSKDSQAIFVHASRAERQPILRITVPGGEIKNIASTADFRSGEPANYFFGGLTPANEPLVRPRIGTGDLYMLDLDRR